MGLMDFLRGPNIDKGVEEFRTTEGAYLIDVREPDEYRGGHIPESKNIPLSRIQEIEQAVEDKNAPVFCYCLSGNRSSQAVGFMKRLGYTNVTNIGGISSYSGEKER